MLTCVVILSYIKTNIGAFATYIAKDCYPSGMERSGYKMSVEVERLLLKPDKGNEGVNRMMHLRQLRAMFIN